MLFWQFFNIIICFKIVGKIPDQYLSVWLFSNPAGDNVQILVKSTGQICPVILHLFWTFIQMLIWYISNNLDAYDYVENCKNNISVYGFSPIQGTTFYSCWNLMKPGFQREHRYYYIFICSDKGWIWSITVFNTKIPFWSENSVSDNPTSVKLSMLLENYF